MDYRELGKAGCVSLVIRWEASSAPGSSYCWPKICVGQMEDMQTNEKVDRWKIGKMSWKVLGTDGKYADKRTREGGQMENMQHEPESWRQMNSYPSRSSLGSRILPVFAQILNKPAHCSVNSWNTFPSLHVNMGGIPCCFAHQFEFSHVF